MSNINLRNGITRTLKYTKVSLVLDNGVFEKYVKGKTTVTKEMKNFLKIKANNDDRIPNIILEEIEETRYMSLEEFIKNSIKINK